MITLEGEVEIPPELASGPTLAAAMRGDTLITVKESGTDFWENVAHTAHWAERIVAGAIGSRVLMATESRVQVFSLEAEELG